MSISSYFSERTYCTRWSSRYTETDTTHFYEYHDRRLCYSYTEEELMEYDTVEVITYMDDMVKMYEMDDIIDPDVEWSTNTLLLYDLYTQPGQIGYNSEKFILYKQETPGEPTKFGWLGINRTQGYGQYGTVTRRGFMK